MGLISSFSLHLMPMHTFCPTGEDSWCRHNQALAAGETPPPHKPRITKPCAKGIEDIYKQLTKLELLNRCCHGKTQNSCKRLNGCIWYLCPKTRYAFLRSVETAVAILWYNKGYNVFADVLNELGNCDS